MRAAVDGLCSHADRGACTDAERRATLWLHDELRSRGHEAWVETVWVRPQRALELTLASALAVAGSLVATTAAIPGLVLAALGALWMLVPLPVLPRRATQHVLTAIPDDGVVLAITAAYDAPKRGFVLNDRWRRLGVPGWLPAACGVAVTAAAAARVAGYEPGWLGAAQLVPTIVLLITLAAALDIALSGWSPGANDNASGVAVALALFDELGREPPHALTPALLLAGAGHPLPRAAGRYLGLPAERVVLLELGPCGAGTPAWNARHAQVRAAAEQATAALGLPEGRRPRQPATRLPAIRIAALDERGLTPRAHQPDDTTVDGATMNAALDLALGVVDALDADLRGSRAPSGPRSAR
jgi:hypothetical protein